MAARASNAIVLINPAKGNDDLSHGLSPSGRPAVRQTTRLIFEVHNVPSALESQSLRAAPQLRDEQGRWTLLAANANGPPLDPSKPARTAMVSNGVARFVVWLGPATLRDQERAPPKWVRVAVWDAEAPADAPPLVSSAGFEVWGKVSKLKEDAAIAPQPQSKGAAACNALIKYVEEITARQRVVEQNVVAIITILKQHTRDLAMPHLQEMEESMRNLHVAMPCSQEIEESMRNLSDATALGAIPPGTTAAPDNEPALRMLSCGSALHQTNASVEPSQVYHQGMGDEFDVDDAEVAWLQRFLWQEQPQCTQAMNELGQDPQPFPPLQTVLSTPMQVQEEAVSFYPMQAAPTQRLATGVYGVAPAEDLGHTTHPCNGQHSPF